MKTFIIIIKIFTLKRDKKENSIENNSNMRKKKKRKQRIFGFIHIHPHVICKTNWENQCYTITLKNLRVSSIIGYSYFTKIMK